MRRNLPVAGLAYVALVAGTALAASGCSLFAGPGPSTPPRTAAPTLRPAFGLTWAMAPGLERPADAFAVSSNPPTGPAHPDTAGHPGNFPGQAIIEAITASADGGRLVAVGYVGIAGDWHARAWTSTDGMTWTLGSIDDRTASFAVSVATAPDGTFVAVGRAGREATAWRSTDGTAWTQATVDSLVSTGTGTAARPARPPELAERMTVVVATSHGLVAGGSVGAELQGDRRARFWRSTDGSVWSPVADQFAAFDGSEVIDIARAGDGLVAIGRVGGGPHSAASLAWTSSDGSSWTRVDDEALAGGLTNAVVASSSGLLAVGSDANELAAVAWSSPDGRTWRQAPNEPSRLFNEEKIRMTDVVTTPAGFVGVGNYVSLQYGTGTSWLSRDGLAWTQAPDQPTFGQGEPEAVLAWRDRLVIVGSRGAPDNYIPTVWLSPGLP